MQVTRCDCCGKECEDYYTSDRRDVCYDCTEEINVTVRMRTDVIYKEARKEFGDATAHSVKLYYLINVAFSCPEPDKRWGSGIMDLYREWKKLTANIETTP